MRMKSPSELHCGLTAPRNESEDPTRRAAPHRDAQGAAAPTARPTRNPQGRGFIFALSSGSLLYLGVSFNAHNDIADGTSLALQQGHGQDSAEIPPTPFPRAPQPPQLEILEPFRTKISVLCLRHTGGWKWPWGDAAPHQPLPRRCSHGCSHLCHRRLGQFPGWSQVG